MKTVKFYTLGCKVNQYDTEALRERFTRVGFREERLAKSADICVINTCTVTRKADTKSRQLIRKAIEENPQSKIIVTGCYAQENTELLNKIYGVDLVIGNDRKDKLLELVEPNFSKIGLPSADISLIGFNGHTRAFVKIQDGCNNSCSYCKVPYVRGRSRSRDAKEIILEVKGLAEKGFKEIVLCGICLGDFGKDLSCKVDLVGLIEELEKIEGLKRIRLSSIEAKDISDALIKKIATSAKLCKHLHIPFQSGDDKILKLMNRSYTRKSYEDLVENLKKNISDIAITTDIIVGFPEETDENFKNTIEFFKMVEPLRTHIFPFSAREGTAAYVLKDNKTGNIIKERASILKELTSELSFSYRKRFLEKELEVLIENSLDKKYNVFKGYSLNYIKVFLKKDSLSVDCMNNLIKVNIYKVDKENTWARTL